MTGLSVAMAVPPQMAVPPPTSMRVFPLTPNLRPINHAVKKLRQMLNMIMGSADAPTPMIEEKLNVPPARIIPALSRYFEEKPAAH